MKNYLSLLSIIAPVLAAAPWILLVPGKAPGLMNSLNGYGGLLVFFGLVAWSGLGILTGLASGGLAIVRGEKRPLAILGLTINGGIVLFFWLKR